MHIHVPAPCAFARVRPRNYDRNRPRVFICLQRVRACDPRNYDQNLPHMFMCLPLRRRENMHDSARAHSCASCWGRNGAPSRNYDQKSPRAFIADADEQNMRTISTKLGKTTQLHTLVVSDVRLARAPPSQQISQSIRQQLAPTINYGRCP